MSHTSGDPTTDPDDRFSAGAVAGAVAIVVGFLVLGGAALWFLPDLTERIAPVIGDDPLVQRLAGWAVWAVFLLPVALVFLRAAWHRARGTRTSTPARWATAALLPLAAVPGFATFGGVGGSDDADIRSALDVVGPDFAFGVLLGRVAVVTVVFVFIGLLVARRGAISDRESGVVAFLRTPAYAALGVLALTLLGAFFLSPA